jgi:hypothetical protein
MMNSRGSRALSCFNIFIGFDDGDKLCRDKHICCRTFDDRQFNDLAEHLKQLFRDDGKSIKNALAN